MKEVCAFLDLLGQKSFWKDKRKAQAAKNGLIFCYAQMTHPSDKVISAIELALSEFTRREVMLETIGYNKIFECNL